MQNFCVTAFAVKFCDFSFSDLIGSRISAQKKEQNFCLPIVVCLQNFNLTAPSELPVALLTDCKIMTVKSERHSSSLNRLGCSSI